MKQNTHLQINSDIVGQIEYLSEGFARATLEATPVMASDEKGLIHGGFTFGLADFAAMAAVNDPLVVLGAASSTFLAPVRVGEVMVAEARRSHVEGKKHKVSVEVSTDKKVFSGEFTCYVLKRHVLANRG